MLSRTITLFICLLATTFQGCLSEPNSSLVFPVTGNVHPTGYYRVTLMIGKPPKPYFFGVDTGSDLAWLQCDAPCINCTSAAHELYKPNQFNYLECSEPRCDDANWPLKPHCDFPLDVCGYNFSYVDQGSSLGAIGSDWLSLQYLNGTQVTIRFAFGCGYSQTAPVKVKNTSFVDGVLGLGPGKSSILQQLHNVGITRNVGGHCLSSKGDGYLLLGDEVAPSGGITWVPVSTTKPRARYLFETVDLYFNDKPSGKGAPLVFDSGTTYTYLTVEAYASLFSKLLQEDIRGKPISIAVDDETLPACWKGSKPFNSIEDVKDIFKPIMMSFANADIFHWLGKKAEFQLDPEAYLIITEHGNVCLGILNGFDFDVPNVNIIGEISLQDKIVIYDNEKQQIGWAPANCSNLPKS